MTRSNLNQPDSRELAALAYRDAVKDILSQEGVFALAHRRAPDVVWEFDGHAWRRVDLSELDELADDLPAPALTPHGAELPF